MSYPSVFILQGVDISFHWSLPELANWSVEYPNNFVAAWRLEILADDLDVTVIVSTAKGAQWESEFLPGRIFSAPDCLWAVNQGVWTILVSLVELQERVEGTKPAAVLQIFTHQLQVYLFLRGTHLLCHDDDGAVVTATVLFISEGFFHLLWGYQEAQGTFKLP